MGIASEASGRVANVDRVAVRDLFPFAGLAGTCRSLGALLVSSSSW